MGSVRVAIGRYRGEPHVKLLFACGTGERRDQIVAVVQDLVEGGRLSVMVTVTTSDDEGLQTSLLLDIHAGAPGAEEAMREIFDECYSRLSFRLEPAVMGEDDRRCAVALVLGPAFG
jgi:hypothetical protein